ncbi:uncharacterized protein DS421_16g548160 [Arachis hypogaea]|nr:uncharacterized protein DS421_16g548160 [Arachis hypogaea]
MRVREGGAVLLPPFSPPHHCHCRIKLITVASSLCFVTVASFVTFCHRRKLCRVLSLSQARLPTSAINASFTMNND